MLFTFTPPLFPPRLKCFSQSFDASEDKKKIISNLDDSHPVPKQTSTMNSITTFCLALLLITATLSFAARVEPDDHPHPEITHDDENENDDAGMGDFFGSGTGFGIPGFGVGGGYGGGYGGPRGGYSRGGIIRPSMVCREKGPCYKKKLICPAKCFRSYSRSGKGYGGGGGGGGCTVDCKKKCIAYC